MSAKQVFNKKSAADKERERKEAINKTNRHGTNLFFEAIESNKYAEVLKLHGQGADIHARTTQQGFISNLTVNVPYAIGATPLHAACLLGSPDIADLLIRRGANVKAQDTVGHTPLDYAILSYNYFKDDLAAKQGSRFTMQRTVEKSSTRLTEFEDVITKLLVHGAKPGMFELPEKFRLTRSAPPAPPLP